MRPAIGRFALGLAAVAVGGACAAPPVVPPPVRPPPVAPAPPPKLPAWTYWEPVEVPVAQGVEPAALPVEAERLSFTPRSQELWTAAPVSLRTPVLAQGFAVTDAVPSRTRLGDFYASLRDDRVPWVITLDSLFFLAHVAIDRARADVDAAVVAPAVGGLLRRLEARLSVEGRGAVPDVAPAYLLARGLVAVAAALVQPDYRPPEELALLVEGERSRVLAHSAVGVSPWLGLPVDYSAMAPRGQADGDEAHASWFRAMAWLQQASLALEGRGEDDVRAQVDVGTARTHARAAILLSRLVERDVDAEAASSWERLDRLGDLLVGDPDDATPRDVAAAASASQLDLRSATWVADVVATDRVRRACARKRDGRLDDGAGGVRAVARHDDNPPPVGRLFPAFRLLDPRYTPDSGVLQSLVFPAVGTLLRAEPPPTARDSMRALPSALDVASWLGSTEARDALRDVGDDAYAHYEDGLARLRAARPAAGSLERHRTPYLSFLDTLEAWLAPSMGDAVQPGAATSAWRARKADAALAAWTELRHDAMAMSRVQILGVRLPPREPSLSSVPVFVEPHPEAIAGLLAMVRQASRALRAEGVVAEDSSSVAILDEVQELLWEALGVAVHEASDRPTPPELSAMIAAFPARLRAIEAALGENGGAAVPLAVDVHTDVASGRAVEEALGLVRQMWIVVREPATHRLWLAFGAAVPHAEVVQPMSQRLSDGAWAARLLHDGQAPPGALERAYLVASR